MDTAVHPGLRVADAENASQLRSRLETILNVPHTGKELSWQLGEGGWKQLRLRFLLACGLVRGHFEQPYNPR